MNKGKHLRGIMRDVVLILPRRGWTQHWQNEACVGEDGTLVLADSYQWQDSGGVCAKYSWSRTLLFIYLINAPVLESSAMWEGPFLEL